MVAERSGKVEETSLCKATTRPKGVRRAGYRTLGMSFLSALLLGLSLTASLAIPAQKPTSNPKTPPKKTTKKEPSKQDTGKKAPLTKGKELPKPANTLPKVILPPVLPVTLPKPPSLPLLKVSLSTPRLTYFAGEPIELLVTVRNTATTAQPADVVLTGLPATLIPPDLAHTRIGNLSAGQSHGVRFHLRAPMVVQETQANINVTAGTDGKGELKLKLLSPLTATLETAHLDLDSPGEHAKLRVRLTNRAAQSLSLQLKATQGKDVVSVEVPGGGKGVTQDLEVTAPSTDAGAYPVEVNVFGAEGIFTTLKALIGIPLNCPYATRKPIIDGNLEEWADAEPIGMGRQEQAHGKDWRGPADLSAYAYVKWDEEYFYLACSVMDDVFVQNFPAAELMKGDSVQFALSGDRNQPMGRVGYGTLDSEFGLALLKETQPTLYRFAGPPSTKPGLLKKGLIAIQQKGARLFYEVAIPWTELLPNKPQPGLVLGFSILVNDNDGQGRGYMEWGGGMAVAKVPSLFPPLRLLPKPH